MNWHLSQTQSKSRRFTFRDYMTLKKRYSSPNKIIGLWHKDVNPPPGYCIDEATQSGLLSLGLDVLLLTLDLDQNRKLFWILNNKDDEAKLVNYVEQNLDFETFWWLVSVEHLLAEQLTIEEFKEMALNAQNTD